LRSTSVEYMRASRTMITRPLVEGLVQHELLLGEEQHIDR